jgi:hypothetical protein
MAQANGIISGKFRGTLGKEVVFRKWKDMTIAAKVPDKRTTEPKPEELARRERFLLASRYAKSIINGGNPAMAAAYAAILKPRQNVYSRAVKDFMTPPKVTRFNTSLYKGTPGDSIIVRAVDDFRLTTVRVEVRSAAGTLLEAGLAEQNDNGLDWTYTAVQANNLLAGTKIKAIATDVPGNKGTLEITLS